MWNTMHALCHLTPTGDWITEVLSPNMFEAMEKKVVATLTRQPAHPLSLANSKGTHLSCPKLREFAIFFHSSSLRETLGRVGNRGRDLTQQSLKLYMVLEYKDSVFLLQDGFNNIQTLISHSRYLSWHCVSFYPPLSCRSSGLIHSYCSMGVRTSEFPLRVYLHCIW